MMGIMDILERIQTDYRNFPHDQSFDLYGEDVYFKDPMTSFCGVDRYRQMVGFIEKWFLEADLETNDISQPEPEFITTQWTLHFTAPFPWKPRISIPGRSELRLNEQGLIISHIDYWDCSKWDVVKQLWK
jgi:hypothetical protein